MDRAKRYLRSAGEVQQCYSVNDDVSFITIMLARDLQYFERLVRQHFAGNQDILTYRMLIVLGMMKVGLGILLFGLEERA